MKIIAKDLSKRFSKEWVFKGLSQEFNVGHSYAFLGNNGSGKSTLVQTLIGAIPSTSGTLEYSINNNLLEDDYWYKHISFASPYLELIEELTLEELLSFQLNFKSLNQGITRDGFLELCYLSDQKNKQIRYFSSGMKQRLKLALAMFFESDLLVLDEPTSNLDTQGIAWYLENIEKVKKEKIIFVASNVKEEYSFCTNVINLNDLKK